MKSALLAIVIVAVLAIGGWALYDHAKPKPSSTYSNNTNSSAVSKPSASTSTSNSSSAPSNQSTAPGAVTIKGMMFTPSQISVQKGATVTWTNNDSVAHTVTDDLSTVGGPASGNIAPGSTYSFTFDKTGSFQYHCTIHPSMRGTIVVK